MILKKYDKLPDKMKNEEVKKYYDILKKRKLSLAIKRIFDIVVSLVLLIILSPIMLILAILIKLDSKGPVFYRQERITTNFRITRVGKLIRKLRLDEFPQLLNILAGDMSFVGTRPEVKKYVDKYTDEMKATLLMPAGVTSIASIKYKDEDKILEKASKDGKDTDIAYIEDVLPEKMKYNLEYITKFSFWYDIKTCINTVIEVLR